MVAAQKSSSGTRSCGCQEQVLAALARWLKPPRLPLTDARVLSDIRRQRHKVFFSLTVDAADVQSWDRLRAMPKRRCGR